MRSCSTEPARSSMRSKWQVFTLAVLAITLTPAVGLAQEGGTGKLLSPQFDLGIWTIVIFVALLLVLWKTAWKPMLEGLHKREATIRGSVEEAQRTREEMERLRTQFKAEMDAAYAKIPQLMDEGGRDA